MQVFTIIVIACVSGCLCSALLSLSILWSATARERRADAERQEHTNQRNKASA